VAQIGAAIGLVFARAASGGRSQAFNQHSIVSLLLAWFVPSGHAAACDLSVQANKLPDRAKDFQPVADRNSQVSRVLISRIRKDREINAVFSKTLRVLGACRAFRASPTSPSSLSRSRRQLVEQGFSLLQVECVETLGERVINGREKITGFDALALITP
jgi:hypothetical protein